jgi:hypothetical protein
MIKLSEIKSDVNIDIAVIGAKRIVKVIAGGHAMIFSSVGTEDANAITEKQISDFLSGNYNVAAVSSATVSLDEKKETTTPKEKSTTAKKPEKKETKKEEPKTDLFANAAVGTGTVNPSVEQKSEPEAMDSTAHVAEEPEAVTEESQSTNEEDNW